mgnify:CR=1 FL=1
MASGAATPSCSLAGLLGGGLVSSSVDVEAGSQGEEEYGDDFADSDEEDDAGDFMGTWWGIGVRDATGAVIGGAGVSDEVTEDILQQGARAMLMLKMLPRFPYQRHQHTPSVCHPSTLA